jgi:hypothetical protein
MTGAIRFVRCWHLSDANKNDPNIGSLARLSSVARHGRG